MNAKEIKKDNHFQDNYAIRLMQTLANVDDIDFDNQPLVAQCIGLEMQAYAEAYADHEKKKLLEVSDEEIEKEGIKQEFLDEVTCKIDFAFGAKWMLKHLKEK